MSPLVSILIPAYNSEKWIKKSIESALHQSWSNKEIIIIDDGSTDNTYNIAKKFETKNVKVVKQYNKGASAARNKALSLAQGDFIQWLDADDILAPDKIENQLLNTGLEHSRKILISGPCGTFFRNPLKAKFTSNFLWTDLEPLEWMIRYFQDPRANIFIHSWLVSRQLTELAGLWDERLSLNDDGEYFCRVVAASEFVKFCTESICYYRIGNIKSLSNSKSIKDIQSASLSVNLCVNHLMSFRKNEETKNASIKMLVNFISNIESDQLKYIKDNIIKLSDLGGNYLSPQKSIKYLILETLLGAALTKKIRSVVRYIKLQYLKFLEMF